MRAPALDLKDGARFDLHFEVRGRRVNELAVAFGLQVGHCAAPGCRKQK